MRFLLPLAAILLFCIPVPADEVHLKSGGVVVGTVTDEGDPVVLKTPTGGTIRIGRDKVDRIEKKALPADAATVRREAKPSANPRHVDMFNRYAIRPPAGWKKATTAKGSKATWSAPEEAGPFRMDVWVLDSKTDLTTMYEMFKKKYREAMKGYEPQWEEATMMGKMPARQFAGRFTGDDGRELGHIHTMCGENNVFYLVFFTGDPDKLEAVKPDVAGTLRSFEHLPPVDLTKEKLAEFMRLYQHGVELVHEAKDAEAAAEFGKASEMLPEHADLHQNLGMLHAKLGNYKRAIEEYTTLTKLRADDAAAFQDLGTVLFHENRFPDATKAFQSALELAPDYVEAWINLGAVKTQMAEHERAAECFKVAIEIDPKCTPAWFNLGQVAYLRNRWKESRDAYEQTLILEPEHSGAKEGLKKLKQEGH